MLALRNRLPEVINSHYDSTYFIIKSITTTSSPKNVLQEAENLEETKLNYYRNLNATTVANVKPKGWDNALPFEKLPGPKPFPLIGNIWRFLPGGEYSNLNLLEVHQKMHKDYGDIAILKGIPFRPPFVHIYNADDIEMLHRNEGAWPERDGLQAFHYYATTVRANLLKDVGLLTKQGEEWFKFRSVVNRVIMRPKNIFQYSNKINEIADDLVENMKYFANLNDLGEMPEDFNQELYKWALESIGVVTFNRRLGCLKVNLDKDSEQKKYIDSVLEMFLLMYKLDILPSMWKKISTPTWRRFVSVMDFLVNTQLKYINEVNKTIDNESKNGQIEKSSQETSVFEKLIKIDPKIATSMSIDMMIAGVDTTGRTLGACLYYLAKNPEKQNVLREEAFKLLKDSNTSITKETLEMAPYLKAVIKEVTRLAAIAVGILRTTPKDLVLGGYQIPKGTQVITSNLSMCLMEKHFVNANEFIPERWLSTTSGELSHKNTNPFVYSPFGYGPRACIGKRIANLEMEVALLKIVRNFEMAWPHEDMKFKSTFIYGIGSPLKLHVKPLH